MPIITSVRARQIFDSRGNPTTEVSLILNDMYEGTASTPSGASVGQFEAKEIRDISNAYKGGGVLMTVDRINVEIAPYFISKRFDDQKSLDDALLNIDNTHDKSNIGANASLPISIAFAKALAKYKNQPLFKSLVERAQYKIPTPMLNIINGGKHADNGLDIQEFMIVPQSNKIHTQLQIAHNITYNLKIAIKKAGLSINVGDEGGFAPQITNHDLALHMLTDAVNRTQDEMSLDQSIAKIALDVAASEFYRDQCYTIENEQLNSDELTDYYQRLLRQYPAIFSLEDPFAEFDEYGWKLCSEILGQKTQLVGDDLFVTNTHKLQHGINNQIANAIIIKPNQIGTLTETFDAVKVAKNNDYNVIVSHRSGDTEDNFIAHLAVAVDAEYIKAGALARGERTAKYNELLRIHEMLAVA